MSWKTGINLFSFCLIIFLISCKGSSDFNKKKIGELETNLNKHELDTSYINDLDSAYSNFIKIFPSDSATPYFQYRQALLNDRFINNDFAEKLYLDYLTRFPKHRMESEAIFFLAFMYDNEMNRKQEAIRYYKKYIELYPNGKHTNDIRVLIKMAEDPEYEKKLLERVSNPG